MKFKKIVWSASTSEDRYEGSDVCVVKSQICRDGIMVFIYKKGGSFSEIYNVWHLCSHVLFSIAPHNKVHLCYM